MNAEDVSKCLDTTTQEKLNMEHRIQSAVAEAVREFYEATGVTPDYISISMIDRTVISDSRRQYAVGAVYSNVTL